MNYYHQWWEKARNQPGTILTKKQKHLKELSQKEAEKALLKAENFELQTSSNYQSWLELTEENQELKHELTNLEAFAREQYQLIQSQEQTLQEQENTIQGLTTSLNQKNNLLSKKTTLLRQFLAEKQEQLRTYE